jgi:hypothetical protein
MTSVAASATDRSDQPLELAHVAGPVVGDERVGGRGRQPKRPGDAVALEKVPRELENVGATLAKRRHTHVDAAQPVIEVGTKQLPLDQLQQTAVGGGDNPDVEPVGGGAADALHGEILNGPESLACADTDRSDTSSRNNVPRRHARTCRGGP